MNDKPLVWMFSGQGSQYYRMAEGLYTENRVFRGWMDHLDKIACEQLGCSIVALLYDEASRKSKPFERILYSHPALFMVQYALSKTLMSEGMYPDCVLGTSVGEYVAAAVAKVMDADRLLQDVIVQAKMLEQYCGRGGMIAILKDISFFQDTAALHHCSELAGINYNNHFVISGYLNSIEGIVDLLKQASVVHQVLPVLYGFHSSAIDNAGENYIDELSKRRFAKPEIPFVSCVEANLFTDFSANYFWDVIRKPIVFQRTIKKLEKNQPGTVYVDMGPSGTLAGFAKHNFRPESTSSAFTILTPYGKDNKNLAKLMMQLMSEVV